MSGRQSRDRSGERVLFLVGLFLVVAGPTLLILSDTGRNNASVGAILAAGLLFWCGIIASVAAVVVYMIRNYTSISGSSVGLAGVLLFVPGVFATATVGFGQGAVGPIMILLGSPMLIAAGTLRVVGE
jgi:hypothetical protein